jgi:putative copper resistance protein D
LALVIWGALGVAVLSGLGWLLLLAADMNDTSVIEASLQGSVWSVLTETRFGMVWCARLVLALVLGVLVICPRARWLAFGAAALLLALLALIGHGGATPGLAGRIHLASDMVHLLAAGAWLGGLPALAFLLTNAGIDDGRVWSAFAVDATSRFSMLGIVSVTALLTSGAVNSWNLLAGPSDLLSADYGQLVALKIGLFAAMVGIATFNKYRLTPHLPRPGIMRKLVRNTVGEIGLGLSAILVVGALGNMAPSAHQHSHTGAVPSDAAFVHIHSDRAMAEVTIQPGRPGMARVTILLMKEDFSPFTAKDVVFDFSLEGHPEVRALSRPATLFPNGNWEVDKVEIERPGVWIVNLIIRTDKSSFELDGRIAIDR